MGKEVQATQVIMYSSLSSCFNNLVHLISSNSIGLSFTNKTLRHGAALGRQQDPILDDFFQHPHSYWLRLVSKSTALVRDVGS